MDLEPIKPKDATSLVAVNESGAVTISDLESKIREAKMAWLMKSPSRDTRSNYSRDLDQFLAFNGILPTQLERFTSIRPQHVSQWRDSLSERGLSNATIGRKITVLRSLFSYLKTYGYLGINPAHPDFVSTPPVSKDGKTVGLSAADCRRFLDSPSEETPVGIRDRAIIAILAYTGCRVGELTRLKVGSFKLTGTHRVVDVYGKGGKERSIALHQEAVTRLDAWLEVAGLRGDVTGPMFRPTATPHWCPKKGFATRPFSRRAIQKLVDRYVVRLGLDPNVTVHSMRVTALTTARERGSDIIDLQDYAGHSDPRTTLAYIRTRDRLDQSPAYVLKY